MRRQATGDRRQATGDVRPVPPEPLGVTFGYHLDDLNLPAGNIVKDVRTEEAPYRG
jgi:hypothetical protein